MCTDEDIRADRFNISRGQIMKMAVTRALILFFHLDQNKM